MCMWKTHAASGLLAAEASAPLIPHTAGALTLPLYAAVCVVGSLVPDLDHRDGKLSHSLGPITWLLCRVVVWTSKGLFLATRGPRDFTHSNGHRGITHTPVFAPVVAVAAWALTADRYAVAVAVGLLVGVLAHQIGDACTDSGIPMLWPFKINGRRWGHYGLLPVPLRFKTGHAVESVVLVGVLAACVGVVVFYAWLGWPVLAELTR
jgi:membrane-bound metal-dependent hydrolase YbcI (DUF457 family)